MQYRSATDKGVRGIVQTRICEGGRAIWGGVLYAVPVAGGPHQNVGSSPGPGRRARRAAPSPADRFRDTRAAHEDETAEDYCEAIAQFTREHGHARVRDLARFMGVSHVTVIRIVKRLEKAGLLATEPYKPITLTPEGRKIAERTGRRHAVVLEFLLKIGVPPAHAQIDAEGIEHHVSEQTIRALKRVLVTLGAESPTE